MRLTNIFTQIAILSTLLVLTLSSNLGRCGPSCFECNISSGKCLSCLNSKYDYANGECNLKAPQDSHCRVYNKRNDCILCRQGFYYRPALGKCVAMEKTIRNCFSAIRKDRCESCLNGVPTFIGDKCEPFEEGFHNDRCKIAKRNRNAKVQCLVCKQGFIYGTARQQTCRPLTEISEGDKLTGCMRFDGLIHRDTLKRCSICRYFDGYYLNAKTMLCEKQF